MIRDLTTLIAAVPWLNYLCEKFMYQIKWSQTTCLECSALKNYRIFGKALNFVSRLVIF